MLTLPENGRAKHVFRVIGGRTLELSLAKWWASLGACAVSYKLHFYGLGPLQRQIVLASFPLNIYRAILIQNLKL